MQQTPTPDNNNVFDSKDPEIDSSKQPDIDLLNTNRQVRLVKKKKKKNRMSPTAMYGYEERKKQQFVEGAQRVFVDGRTFQQIIETCRKPKRLPPSCQTSPKELQQQVQEKEEAVYQPELRFHIPRVDPLKDKHRKRKELFLRKEQQIDEYGSQEIDEIAIQNANTAIKRQLQIRKGKNLNLQQKMLRFLKKKYNQQEPEPQGEMSPLQ